MADKKAYLLNTAQDYIFIVLGLACYAFGFTAFILPEKIVIGGVAGMASLLYYQWGIPVAWGNYGINIILLLMAAKIVGMTFVKRTVFGTTVLSFLIFLFQELFSNVTIVTGQPFMSVVIGALLCGFGIGLTFVHNGSSGGTDIIAAMVSKHSNVTIGRMILYVDFLIISSSYLLFHSIDKIVYGVVFVMILSFVTDLVINSNRQAVQFMIFSDKWEEIADAIIRDAHRGCTILNGTGWYTKNDVTILMVMCRKIESVTIFRIVKSIDKHAFVTQSKVNGVYGRGFDHVKVKMKDISNDVRHVHPQTYYDAEGNATTKSQQA
ncbi:MAG: YitT family protein [Muribaculaceae bacterium]|nr:YitT family protein [Muribaculaceae bacterium]